ncbi:MAG: hypothetical protein KGI93_02485 [Acidobacteriota bacterium]|nr:hypothetical protein [Acidobacteriota bacterium]
MFPVAFDELAMAEDCARLGHAGIAACAELGREIDRLGGLPRERLLACEAEGRDGTRLPGCVKTYVPWPAGRFGAVMVAVSHLERPVGLRVIAFGVRHHPRGAQALTVYQIAHLRLNA